MTDAQQKKLNLLTAPLLSWYDRSRRDLPWRRDGSPYAVWVSEIMLQQTRVAAVIPYYERFMRTLPTVDALASADEETLLKLWEGLGYYSRARNLQKAAQTIVRDYGGTFPHDYGSLLRLSGVGEYTAAAIASIAFSQPVSAVDGNLLRIGARITLCRDDVTDVRTRRAFRAAFDEAIDPARPGEYNQALMDLGSAVCLSHGAPLCRSCPARGFCSAHEAGEETAFPVRRAKKPRRIEERTVFLLFCGDSIALRKRPETGLLASLWEFPGAAGNLDESSAALTLASWGVENASIEPTVRARHLFSHVEWDMKGYVVRTDRKTDGFFWADAHTFSQLAVPSAFTKYTSLARTLLPRGD